MFKMINLQTSRFVLFCFLHCCLALSWFPPQKLFWEVIEEFMSLYIFIILYVKYIFAKK